MTILSCLFVLTGTTVAGYAQADSTRSKMLRALTGFIKSHYVSATLAGRMCDSINQKFLAGQYDSTLNPDEFAFELTRDLRRISRDPHISITTPQWQLLQAFVFDAAYEQLTEEQKKKLVRTIQKGRKRFYRKYNKRTKEDMFTYGDVKILPGNVGYVEIKEFTSTSYYKSRNKGRIKLAEVMKFLKNTDALIIDLKDNQGGPVRQAATFCSYFSPRPNHYFMTTEWHSRYDSGAKGEEVARTVRIMTRKRIDNAITRTKPVYVLTSRWTFSAAELAVYKLKQFNPSALIIGEKTPGGGNGHTGGYSNPYFFAIIPEFRVFDESNANYTLEAKGITPDIAVREDSAFFVAYALALNGRPLKDTSTLYYKRTEEPVVIKQPELKNLYPDYAGDYRKIRIVKENDRLYMVYDIYFKTLLLPVARDLFIGENIRYVSFLRNRNGQVSELHVRHSGEFSEYFTKKDPVTFTAAER